MLSAGQLQSALPSLPLTPVHGLWTRAVGYHLLHGPPPGAPPGSRPRPLWPGGASLAGARFTPRGAFGSIYLASDPVTALLEVTAVLQHSHAPAFTLRTYPWTVFAVDGVVTNILDLTDPNVWPSLGTNLQELTGDWAYGQDQHLLGRGPLPPTQLLGQAVYNGGVIAGMKYPSAKNVGRGEGLVVFSDRLVVGGPSHLAVYDPHRLLEDRLP